METWLSACENEGILAGKCSSLVLWKLERRWLQVAADKEKDICSPFETNLENAFETNVSLEMAKTTFVYVSETESHGEK